MNIWLYISIGITWFIVTSLMMNVSPDDDKLVFLVIIYLLYKVSKYGTWRK